MAREIGTKNYQWDLTELKKMYWDDGLSTSQIAEKLGITGTAVRSAFIRFGIPKRSISESLSGSRHYRWQGGRSKVSDGYVELYMPEHPRANRRKRVFEHIVVWENTHGRKLRKGEHVHHLNGVKDDNRPENLMAMSSLEHIRWIPTLQKHIRELETEIKRLSQSVMQLEIPKEEIKQECLSLEN